MAQEHWSSHENAARFEEVVNNDDQVQHELIMSREAHKEQVRTPSVVHSIPLAPRVKPTSGAVQGGHWTDEEHDLFLDCWSKNIRSWKEIANIMKTRTNEQIRTHAQKYFTKLRELKYRGFKGEYRMDGKRVMTKTFLSTARKGCLGKFDWSQAEGGRRRYQRQAGPYSRKTKTHPNDEGRLKKSLRVGPSSSSDDGSTKQSGVMANALPTANYGERVNRCASNDSYGVDRHHYSFQLTTNGTSLNKSSDVMRTEDYHDSNNSYTDNCELQQDCFAMSIQDPISLLEKHNDGQHANSAAFHVGESTQVYYSFGTDEELDAAMEQMEQSYGDGSYMTIWDNETGSISSSTTTRPNASPNSLTEREHSYHYCAHPQSMYSWNDPDSQYIPLPPQLTALRMGSGHPSYLSLSPDDLLV